MTKFSFKLKKIITRINQPRTNSVKYYLDFNDSFHEEEYIKNVSRKVTLTF